MTKDTPSAARKRALGRLAKEFPDEYKGYLAIVRELNWDFNHNQVVEEARLLLSKRFKPRYDVLYEEEKKAGPRPPQKDYEALARRAYEVYGTPEGRTVRDVAKTLGVSYCFARKSIAEAKERHNDDSSNDD